MGIFSASGKPPAHATEEELRQFFRAGQGRSVEQVFATGEHTLYLVVLTLGLAIGALIGGAL